MLADAIAALVAASTLLFVVWNVRSRSADQHVTATAPLARLGIALQGFGFAAVFMSHNRSSALFQGWGLPRTLLPWASVACVVAAWTLLLTARRELGRQWSVSARLVEGHRLITTGPYRWVRHPIYLGLLFLLIAAGLAETTPPWLAVAIALFLTGFAVRIRAEERLLREAFGGAWEEYRTRVPAILPFTAFGSR